jgi:hypothetical protein
MAKQIIILETNPADGGTNSTLVVLWVAVPLARRVPRPNAQSKWEGASAADVTAIQDGSILEEVHNVRVPASYTAAETKAVLEKFRTDRVAWLGAQPNKVQYAGVFFDSVTGWSA